MEIMTKPFSQACENNKGVILELLITAFNDNKKILEIGTGTGQHSVHFAKHLPQLVWQTTDQPQYHAGINQWLAEANLPNLIKPLSFNVNDKQWPLADDVDGVFSANTLHIMSWPSVQNFFKGVGEYLPNCSSLCVYGPFNYAGKYTSTSNARFDMLLAQQNEGSGIRDFEAVDELASEQGFKLLADNEMPANNRLLHWQKE
jgi:cyclopropane fatty-acyl-phospholipid synthase-like methyltransferase